MVGFIQRLNATFTDADREACLPVIGKIYELAYTARSKGLLALESLVQHEESVFLKRATMLIVDANDPKYVRESLQLMILLGNHSGAELLSRLMMIIGVLRIAAGSNPRSITEQLAMMLGDEYFERAEKIQKEEDEKRKPIENFIKNLKYNPDAEKNKIRDRYHFIRGNNYDRGAKKNGIDFFTKDFNTTETLDLLLYDVSWSMKSIIDKVEHEDIVTIFKSGDCAYNTYRNILENGMSKSKQLKFIVDVAAAPKPEAADVEEAKKRIIKVIKKLGKDGHLYLW